jgi:hypothetical protein
MQDKADETECPRILPGATVGSESLKGIQNLSGMRAGEK